MLQIRRVDLAALREVVYTTYCHIGLLPLPGRLMVGQRTLNPFIGVRIPAGQPFDSSKAAKWTRSWLGQPIEVSNALSEVEGMLFRRYKYSYHLKHKTN